MQSGWLMVVAIPSDAAAGPAVRAGECGADPLHGYQPFSYHSARSTFYGGGALLLGMAGDDGYEGIGGFPDSFYRVPLT